MASPAPSRVTSQVAAFAAGLRLADIPGPVRAKAKLHILDSIGCGIAGAASELSRAMLAYLELEHRAGPCPVLGSERRFGPAAAAFGNAVAMNALDFDDCVERDGKGLGHPGATIVAAAASAAFVHDSAGAAFLAAVVAAYEINNRLIAAMQPSIERFRQVYGVCQHQAVGATIAFGKVAGLAAPALENIIGLAATLAPLPSLRKYNWDERPLISFKDFNAPAAEAGVRAAALDACGLVGSKGVLDGETGLWRMLGSDRFDADGMTARIGLEWRLMDSSFKSYPACRWLHTALEAFETVLAAHSLSAPAIEAVTVHTSSAIARDFMDHDPASMVDAEFSLPFALSAIAHGIRPAATWYAAQTLGREDLLSFAQRVAAVVDPEIDAMMSGPARRPAGRVSVRAGGRVYSSARIDYAKGSAENPMAEDEILAKFMDNAGPVLGRDRAERLRDRLERLEDEPHVADLLGLATGSAGR